MCENKMFYRMKTKSFIMLKQKVHYVETKSSLLWNKVFPIEKQIVHHKETILGIGNQQNHPYYGECNKGDSINSRLIMTALLE